MGGTVTDVVHGGRSVYVEFYKGGSKLFNRANVKLDTTDEHKEEKNHEEEVKGSELESQKDTDLEESFMTPRRAKMAMTNGGEPRKATE